MRKVWKILRWTGLAVLLVAGYSGYRIGFGKPFTMNELANRQAFLWLVKSPEVFTQVGIVDGTVFDWHSSKLAAVGVKKRDDDYAMAERFVRQVKEFDRAKLDRQDQVTYDILLDQWDTALSFKRFDWLSSEGLYPIAPMWGTQVQLPNFLETQHTVTNDKTARNYVKRLEATGDKLDAVTGEMLRQARSGVVVPISLLEKAENGITETVRPSAKDNPLVTPFVTRKAVKNRVYPAYTRMTEALESQRAAATNQAAGVGRLPDGAAYYAATLRQMTTTDYTPEQLHALGLSEASRVTAEMDGLLKSQGLSTGTVAERVHALHKDPRFLLPNTDEGRKQLLAKYRQILDEVNARMPEYFRTIPSGKLLVQRVPISAENNVAGAYYQGAAMDGSRPGTFFANLRDVSETATWTMKTLAYHEGIPGHHFQGSIALNLKDLPKPSTRRTRKAGRSMQSSLRLRSACTRTIRSAISGGSRLSFSVQHGWSWTRACIPRAGPASRRSPTWSPQRA